MKKRVFTETAFHPDKNISKFSESVDKVFVKRPSKAMNMLKIYVITIRSWKPFKNLISLLKKL